MTQPGRNRGSGSVKTATAAAIALGALASVAATACHGNAGQQAPWTAHIRAADEALARGDLTRAIRAWNQAYAVARVSRRWDALLEVGRASLRFGGRPGLRFSPEQRARELFLDALFIARRDGSVDGVLQVAEAFAGLEDREVVRRCLRVAERLAEGNADAQADVQAFVARLSDWLLVSGE
jgi:hypothetical protein